ncbi:MAG: calcium-binding protein [Methylobacter sp.]
MIEVINFVNAIDTVSDTVFLNFGTFTVFDINDANLQGDLSKPNLKLDDSYLDKAVKPNDGALDTATAQAGTGNKSAALMNSMKNAGSFAFPLITDPSQIFNLLLGKDATLVTFDMKPLELEFRYRQYFPIFGPLGASIGGSLGAKIDFDFGFDTYGINKFIQSGAVNPALIFAGFYIDNSIPKPELVINGSLTAMAELNLGVARGGVGGGVFATVNFDMFDPNRDGKVRVDEIVNSIVFANYNPLAAFDISGNVIARLFWEVEVNLLLVQWSKSGTIAEFELVDFQIDFPRSPILATDIGNGVLQLNMGEFADQRLNGNVVDGSETFTITDNGNSVTVSAFGATQTYSGISKIMARTGEGNDSITLTNASNLHFDVEGGAGNDSFDFSQTTGQVIVKGGAGHDTIKTGSGNDIIWGNEGNDVITVAGGDNWVFGDEGKIDKNGEYIKVRTGFDDGNDSITVNGTGTNLVFGGGGIDIITGGEGVDLIVGDGAEVLKSPVGVTPALISQGFAVSVDAISRTESGQNHGADHLKGRGGNDIIFGGNGDNTLEGGAGNDTIFGGNDRDSLDGGNGDDVIYGGNGSDTLNGGDGNDKLYGEVGNDVINGGLGNDSLYGGIGNDTLAGGVGNDQLYGETGDDLLYGNDGNDTLDGGTGNDKLWGGAGNDTLISSKGNDVLDGEEGADTYEVYLDGFENRKLVTVFDSGVDESHDELTITATDEADRFLLRANNFWNATLGGLNPEGIAFVAMMNNDKNLERIDYSSALEKMIINGGKGDDYFALDDNRTKTVINGDEGDDVFQIGQMYNTERTVGEANIQAHPNPFSSNDGLTDEFATIRTTRGYLSNGISFATEINGGLGDDQFTVFHNIARLDLNGEAGDDEFTVRAFALYGSQDVQRERTNIAGGTGVNNVGLESEGDVDESTLRYVLNALVNIDGGEGNDTLRVIGTEFSDDFVITADGIFGAGLTINFVNIENIIVDGAEGNDRFFIQGIDENTNLALVGGLGSDSFNVGGNSAPVVIGVLDSDGNLQRDADGNFMQENKIFTHNKTLVDIQGILSLQGMGESTISIGSLGDTLRLPEETDTKAALGGVVGASSSSLSVKKQDLENAGYTSIEQLLTLTVEITDGSGKGQARIVESVELDGDNVVLNVGPGSPSLPAWPWESENRPNATSSFTLSDTNPNLLVNEAEQVDIVTIFNNDSEVDESGILTRDSLTGFGMGSGLQYFQMENLSFNLGQGSDNLIVESTHTRIDNPDYQTMTLIYAGDGDDTITVNLDETDGFVAIQGEAGNDTIDASNSTRRIIALGDEGFDTLYGGAGDDILLGDRGRIDYLNDDGQVITRLGLGHDFSQMVAVPVNDSQTPADQTDGIKRAPALVMSLASEGGAEDLIFAGGGNDVVIGGEGGDWIDGQGGDDLILGDSGELKRYDAAQTDLDIYSLLYRSLTGSQLYHLDGSALVSLALHQALPQGMPDWMGYVLTLGDDIFASDVLVGGANNDMLFGQLGNDTLLGDGAIIVNEGLKTFDSTGRNTDGHDYLEGNDGDDTIYGGLGQDDIIGGSSNHFGYADHADGADTLFGGTGERIARNDVGGLADLVDDHDFIVGDNANIYRLSGLKLNYNESIHVRVLDWLNYTPGVGGLGAADVIQGEGGDDIIYGLTGNDVLFGNAGNDDIYGGSGHDRIYGGTGDDGIIADDGIIYTSINGLTEPLHGINAINSQTLLTLPGPTVGALVYVAGEINKSVYLLAYNQGAPNNGDDIVYGGLGNDFIHGGEGNDAISGTEALPEFYHTNPAVSANEYLRYDAATGKFADYNANDPFTKITGFFLNFNAGDLDPEGRIDGKDRIFGGSGHDWLVGGPGKDRLFGGLGDDLINADDNLDTQGGANKIPDAPDYAHGDFAFGGGGRDVLIANTGNDRLFDWSGEFNSFFVPFSQFGPPTVNRTVSPQIVDFLLKLGAAEGADKTLSAASGELGLIRQSDAGWGDQNGAPRDPQPGTVSGGRIDTTGAPEGATVKGRVLLFDTLRGQLDEWEQDDGNDDWLVLSDSALNGAKQNAA